MNLEILDRIVSNVFHQLQQCSPMENGRSFLMGLIICKGNEKHSHKQDKSTKGEKLKRCFICEFLFVISRTVL